MRDRLRPSLRLSLVLASSSLAPHVLGSCAAIPSDARPDRTSTSASSGGVEAAPPSSADGGAGGAQAGDAGRSPPTYDNPVFAGDFPDPFVLREGSRYYAFSTNSAGKNVRVVTSTDLATWNELPDALPILPSWAKASASLTWAPSVLRRGQGYVLYFTARSVAADFQCIGHAVASNPAGPYVDSSSAPFVCQVDAPQALCGSIDASPFVDENGDAYLLWKSDENAAACGGDARIWTQRLGIDGMSLLGEPSELLQRDRTWESPLIEGPSMVKFADRYYLFYSASWWESASYGVGYAICATPLGPCAKKTLDGPLVGSEGEALGPGGQEFFTDPKGKLWMAYHAWTSPLVGYGSGGARSLHIDPLQFSAGVPALAGPTGTPTPL